jgi:DNA-binding transcriptional LysR family regulator
VPRRALLGQIADIDIRLLRIFRTVAECGGFAAAELELNISRSTISRHIAALEHRLGIRLCRRGRGGFALSSEGQKIYDAALRMLGSLDEFRASLDSVHSRLTGRLAIALFDKTATNPAAAIAKGLRRFEESAPDVELAVHVAPINDIERGVMEGRFQLGVIPIHRPSSSLAYHPLFLEEMFLYVGRGHPLFGRDDATITPAEVTRCKYTGMGFHSPNMEVGLKLGLRRAATCYDQEAVAHLVISGGYLGFLPDHYAQHFVDLGQIRRIRPRHYHYQCRFDAIVRREPAPSRAAATLLQCLIEAHKRLPRA